MPGIDVKLGSYDERMAASERFYNSEESLEDNQSTTSSTESRQSDFQKKDHEFIPTRSSGILSSKPASNPAQFTRINSNPLLISAQKQMLLVDEVKKKKQEIKVGEDIPEWQSNLDVWKSRRRKQSEDAITRVSEMKRMEEQEFMQNVEKRKLTTGTHTQTRSIGKKLSIQVANDDEIDWEDLGLDSETSASSLPSVTSGSKSALNGSRRQSQQEQIPEEIDSEENSNSMTPINNVKINPYEDAIEGYKSFAKSHLSSEENTSSVSPANPAPISPPKVVETHTLNTAPTLPQTNVLPIQDEVPSPSIPSKSSSASSIPSKSSPVSSLSTNSPSPILADTAVVQKDLENSDIWKEKIESFVQPSRRVSSELSNNMKLKLASFEENKTADSPIARNIEPDESFTDKLKVFKSIETNRKTETPFDSPKRQDSDSQGSKFKGFPPLKSTSSSSFMNTYQNNKFFQQNSLGSENDDENEDNQLVDDALEESFSVLEDNPSEQVVFKDDDFLPDVTKLPPPDEKPPPLPSAPPPMEKNIQLGEEDDIDKQEREIIESLEREEQEHNKYLESLSTPRGQTSSVHQTKIKPEPINIESEIQGVRNSFNDYTTPRSAVTSIKKSVPKEPVQDPVINIAPRKKDKSEGPQKDYNKHWLIQEAEQRRITEAKQRQMQINNPVKNNQNYEKLENVNNNSGQVVDNEMRAQHKSNGGIFNGEKPSPLISDNIYANIDSTTMTFNKSQGTQFQSPVSHDLAGVSPKIPGPQVPPRAGEGQDRVLSVSGKKKCSHCKLELGRGAAMIIESLRLFYHIRCFQCCVCSVQLGNGSAGTDVRVRNNKLHCQNCYSNDEGLKFSKV